jgi:hypothetical protein
MKIDYNEIISQIESFIRVGNFKQARAELIQLFQKTKIPKRFIPSFANLSRRVGLIQKSLNLLYLHVRTTKAQQQGVLPAEKIEYGCSLVAIGSIQEGINLLKEFNNQQYPQAQLFMAFGSIAQWNYGNAAQLLEQYIKNPAISPYQQLTGQLNLVSCYEFLDQFSKGLEVIDMMEKQLKNSQHQFLKGSTYLQKAKLHLGLSDLASCFKALSEAEKLITESQSNEQLFLQLIRTIAHYKNQDINQAQVKNQLVDIKDRSLTAKSWEMVRNCDRYLAELAHDQESYLHFYAGTPYQQLKEKIAKEISPQLPMIDFYERKLMTHSLTPLTKHIDVTKGVERTSGGKLKLASNVHRLLNIFCSDFYRNFSSNYLYSLLFPNEYYNPDSSPSRIQINISRLRQWFSDYEIPLEILEENSFYRLQAFGPVVIKVPTNSSSLLRNQDKSSFQQDNSVHQEVIFEQTILSLEHDIYFAKKDLAKKLDISEKTAQRILHKLCTQGKVIRINKGRATRYMIKSAA